MTAAGPHPPADRSVFRRPEPLTSPPMGPCTQLTNRLLLQPVCVTDRRGRSMPGPANQWEVYVFACFLPLASSSSTAAEPIKAEQLLPQPIQHPTSQHKYTTQEKSIESNSNLGFCLHTSTTPAPGLRVREQRRRRLSGPLVNPASLHGHGGPGHQAAAAGRRREGQVHRDAVHQLRRRQLQGRRAAPHRQVPRPRLVADGGSSGAGGTAPAKAAPVPAGLRWRRAAAAAGCRVDDGSTGYCRLPGDDAGAEARAARGGVEAGGHERALRLRRPVLHHHRRERAPRRRRQRLPLLKRRSVVCALRSP